MGINRYDTDIPEHPLDSAEAGEQESLLDAISNAVDGCLGAATVLFALGAVAATMLAWRAKNPIPAVCFSCGSTATAGDADRWWCNKCRYGGPR